MSGAIFIPPGKAPAGGRDVIAWAHPTSGVVEKCAPSLMPDTAGMIWGLQSMLAKGYVVVATDYPGLGTPGIHPYLIGESEGRAVLDSVRAARAMPQSGASNRFVVWGHSQGGHAALYTGELAKSYAPELELRRGRRGGARHLSHRAVRLRQVERDRQRAHRHGDLVMVESLSTTRPRPWWSRRHGRLRSDGP